MSTPKPLNAVNALRLHLKQLERGVNEARTRRLGPAHPSQMGSQLGSSFGSAASSASGGNQGSGGSAGFSQSNGMQQRSGNPSFNSPPPMSRQPSSYPLPTPATPVPPSSVSSKPKAKPKNGADFGAFFQDINKREAS